ncbi:flippase [Rhodococcus sp. NPDC058521]|uniref:flippase n=1 Tax=Rhodococcus sp. NPDC058521 TaxID=3346536 RepID=UPI003660A7E7
MEQPASDGGETLGHNVSTRRIVHAFSTQLVFRVLGMIASVFTVALTTRHLGPTSYGHLTTAIVFVGLWTSFTELGIGSVIVRRVTSGTGDLQRLIRVNVGMSLVYCVPLSVMAAVSGLAIYRDEPEVRAMLLIMVALLAVTTVLSCFEPIFIARVDFRAAAVSDFLGRLVAFAATGALIAASAPLIWFAVVQVVPFVVQLVVQGITAWRTVRFWPVFAYRESWHLLRESLPQTGVLIIGVLYWRTDGVLLSLLSTPEEVGVYGLAFTIAFTVSVVSQFFLSSTLSTMTARFSTDKAAFAVFVQNSMRTMFLVAAPIAVVGVILAGPVVRLVGSDEFVEVGGPTLALLFVAVGATFLNGVLGQALFAAHDQVFLLRLNIANLVVNIALNLVLIPQYGALGAGAAMVVAEVTGLVITTWRLQRKTPYRTPYLRFATVMVPVACAGGVAALTSDWSILISGPLAMCVYFAVNLAVGPAKISVIKDLMTGTDDTATEPADSALEEAKR